MSPRSILTDRGRNRARTLPTEPIKPRGPIAGAPTLARPIASRRCLSRSGAANESCTVHRPQFVSGDAAHGRLRRAHRRHPGPAAQIDGRGPECPLPSPCCAARSLPRQARARLDRKRSRTLAIGRALALPRSEIIQQPRVARWLSAVEHLVGALGLFSANLVLLHRSTLPERPPERSPRPVSSRARPRPRSHAAAPAPASSNHPPPPAARPDNTLPKTQTDPVRRARSRQTEPVYPPTSHPQCAGCRSPGQPFAALMCMSRAEARPTYRPRRADATRALIAPMAPEHRRWSRFRRPTTVPRAPFLPESRGFFSIAMQSRSCRDVCSSDRCAASPGGGCQRNAR